MNENLVRDNLRAELKKEIIQNNIYGVDIEEGAIEIARLRFWLSIVIDLDRPEPLPNFDFKFMQGNSLLESYQFEIENENKNETKKKSVCIDLSELCEEKNEYVYDKCSMIPFVEGNEEREDLMEQLKEYYSETDHVKKKKLLEKIEKQVRALLNAKKNQSSMFKTAINNMPLICDKFFLWHLWFKDVFDKGGFDIVIGNPPYIGLGGDLNKIYSPYKYVEPKPSKNKRKATADENKVFKFKTHDGNGDIYCLFYEWGRALLKDNGHLCYITSNKWMRAGYGEGLRRLLATETNPRILIDFNGIKVFENAEVNVNILLFENTKTNAGKTWCSDGGSGAEVVAAYQKEKGVKDAKDISITDKFHYFLTDYMYRNPSVQKFDSSNIWTISSSSVLSQIKTKVESIGTPLRDWSIRINRGILTGCNDAFIIDTTKRDEILANTADYVSGQALKAYNPNGEYARTAALIRPILRGRDIKRYGYKWADLWLINTHNGVKQNRKVIVPRVDINAYPAVKEYLNSRWDDIKDRCDQGDTPYNLRNCAYIHDFDLPKIVYGQFQDDAEYSFAEGGVYLSSNEYMIICQNYSPKCLLAYLNCNAMKWQLENTTGSLGGNTKIGQKSNFIKLSIPILPSTKQKQFDDLVDKILSAKKQNPSANTTSYERQIDALVYLLYGITSYEELLEIEGNKDSALQMLILMHIHQQPTDTEAQMIGAIQSSYPTITPSVIQTAISALVNDKVIDYVCYKNFPSMITSNGIQILPKLYVWFQYKHRYPSEETKAKSFVTIEEIDDFAILQHRLVELDNDMGGNYIYRGVNNAAYMMYSSAQRDWLSKHTINTPNDKDGYIKHINSLIKAATPIVSPYLLKNNIPDNEIEVLALMQHYESVSPFVDFSTCIYKALFFAFDDAECSKTGELDDYVALYYVSRNDPYLKKDVQNLYQELVQKVQAMLTANGLNNGNINSEKLKEELKKIPLDQIRDLSHIMVSGNTTTHLKIPAINFVTENTITSMRQMNQNGLFIANLLPNIPLVELINLVGVTGRNIFHCIHISKKLKDEVLHCLQECGIDKQSMYKDKDKDLLKALKNIGKQDI